MIKSFKLLLFVLLLISCSSINKRLDNYKEENFTISYSGGDSFSYESTNPNFICLAFLNNFQDSIVIYKNKKKVLCFDRNDTISYKDMSHEKVFKTIELNTNDRINKIEIILLNERKKISFNLMQDKNLYLISRYNKSWYITVWDKF